MCNNVRYIYPQWQININIVHLSDDKNVFMNNAEKQNNKQTKTKTKILNKN